MSRKPDTKLDLVAAGLTDEELPEEPERWSRTSPPALDWKDHVWPPAGPYGDQFWAAQFRITVDRFHQLVSKHNWQHIPIGRVIYVESTYLLQQLSQLQQPAPTKPIRKRK